MNRTDQLPVSRLNEKRWNRRILDCFWIILILSFLAGAIGAGLHNDHSVSFMIRTIMVPTGLVILVIVLTELLIRQMKQQAEYVLLPSANAIAIILVIAHPEVPIVTSLVLLPIVLSLFYFEPKKVVYTGIVAVCSIALVYMFDVQFRKMETLTNIVVLIMILGGGTFLSMGLQYRLKEILWRLQESIESNQSLMIRTTLMESATKLDGLTGTYNHRTFQEHFEALVKQSELYEIPLHLILFDIDDFKAINDTYGHHIGDVILKRVAHCIKSLISPNDFLARYGGEEFAIILVEKTWEEACRIAETVRLGVAAIHHPEIENHIVTVSAGLGAYKRGQGKEAAFFETDSHLYHAKQTGKNRTVWSNEAKMYQ